MTALTASSQLTFGRQARALSIGSFHVLETSHSAGTRLPRHDHEAPSLNIVLRGGFEERVGRLRIDNRPGVLVVKPSGSHHSNAYGSAETVSMLVSPAEGELSRLGRHARSFGEVRVREGKEVTELGRHLFAALHGCGDSAAHAEVMLAELLADLSQGTQPNPSFRRAPSWLDRIREQIIARSHEKLPIGEIARLEEIELAMIDKAFRRFYGRTPTALLRETRIDRAKAMLARHHLPLTDIALSCGYADQAHFTRSFKRETALTPGAYRRTLAALS